MRMKGLFLQRMPFFGKITVEVSPLKCVRKKKQWLSMLLIIIFMITGMCFEFPEADSYFACTEQTRQEMWQQLNGGFLTQDICTEDLLGIHTKENRLYPEIKGGVRQNARMRLLLSLVPNYIESAAYMAEVAAEKLASDVISRSVAIVCYIHSQDGEKDNNIGSLIETVR